MGFLREYNRATPEQRAQGAAWYGNAQAMCERMAAEYGTDAETVAGIIAALSPRLHWSLNIKRARMVLAGTEPAGLRVPWAKAERIRDGEEPLDVLKGQKVRAFYRALAGDRASVVIDVWMMRAAGRDAESAPTPLQYKKLAQTLKRAARKAKVDPATFQATVWTVVRGRAD
jgi:membrane-bound lytic murein transglycosylase B